MSANAQSVDEQVTCMVNMGFAFDDCQAAVQSGKLSVNDAIEWILNGKPQVSATAGPTLKLKLSQNSEMDESVGFTQPAIEPDAVAMAPMDTETNADITSTLLDVASRLSMSNEQRIIRQRFEEKQREEAKRAAQTDKLAKRKAHAEALKRIQEDREKQKERLIGATSAAADLIDNHASFNSVGSISRASHSTVLQIRLPDSQCVKQTFNADCSLLAVKQYIHGQLTSPMEFVLIQPFPRIEFGAELMDKSLEELGLVPTGSLVVKIDKVPHTSVPAAATLSNDLTQVSHVRHQWGTGHQLLPDVAEAAADATSAATIAATEGHCDDNNENFYDNAMDANELDSDNETDDDNILPVQPQVPLGLAGPHLAGHGIGGFGGHLGGHGIGGFGGLPGLGGPPIWGGGHHNWGVGGQRLAGEVLDHVVLPHHDQDPKELAAEAATKRYGAIAKPSILCNADEVVAAPVIGIPMLRDIVIKYVTGHICSTRYPITGLQCLPAAVANCIVNYLIKEGLLRPKTLQVFNSCRLQEIVLDCYSFCTNELLAVLRHQTCLKTVSLHSCSLITSQGLQHLTALKTLRHLNIGSCRQVNDNCIVVLKDMPSLVTLILENTAVTDVGIIQYANSSPQHLNNLDLSRTNVTHNILPALQAITHLAKLNLEHTKVAGLSGIEHLSELKVLNLANTLIVNDSVSCLKLNCSLVALNIANTINVNGDTALHYLTDLQLVDIQLPDRITTTDRGLQCLANMPLTSLDLTNYINITDVSMEFVGHITTLRKLRLSNTRVTDSGLLFLAGLKELRELHLDRTLITDESVTDTVFRAFSHLQELNLSHTAITNNCLLNGAINVCRELLKLNFNKTNISDKGLMRLHLPFLKMLYIDDTYVRRDKLDQLPACPRLEHVVYRTLRVPPPNEDL